jgi:Spy/CpxP family protein refolding chaperone
MRSNRFLPIAIFAISAMAACSYAFAQGQFMGGPPPPRSGRPITAAETPLDTLTTALSLTSVQQTQISTIQESTRQQVRALMMSSSTGGQGGFQQGGGGQGRPAPPDPATMSKVKDIESDATNQIDALLTSSQLTSLTTLMGQLKDLQAVTISPRLYSKLDLTSDELSQIHAIAETAKTDEAAAFADASNSGDFEDAQQGDRTAHQKARTAALAALTPTQASIVENDTFGQRGPGGPGGDMGGPPPNGAGPDGGGQGGGPQNGGPQQDGQRQSPPPQSPDGNSPGY